jgi:predicted O-methyltransferase YrrM
VSSTLRSPAVVDVLGRLFAQVEQQDPLAKQRVQAREAELGSRVDLLFLDGRNDLYLPVLRLVEPRLAPDALVAADLNAEDPDLLPYLEHVRDPDHGYFSIEIPLDAGVEISARLPTR